MAKENKMNIIRMFLACFLAVGVVAQDIEYGADISYPMHYQNVSSNYALLPHNIDPSIPTPDEYKGMPIQPLGNKQAEYEQRIQRCINHYGRRGNACLSNEKDRIDMSLRQPQSMVNYTDIGFKKIKAPEAVFKLISEFWNANKDKASTERWPSGNTYVNHWDRNSKIVSIEDPSLIGGGAVLKQHIWNAARDTIQQWTGQRLAECSLYGIRIYEEGAVLAPHVDRNPLISSAIINVDQDVDEPWPLEVIGHDGKAYNITMEPGDLVLYESHSILHGRPFPLKGRFFANVFVHFEPIGKLGEESITEGDLPPYIVPGSPQEPVWRRQNPDGWKIQKSLSFTTGTTEAHQMATRQDYGMLQRLLDAQEHLVNAADTNGWTPLHESLTGNSEAILELLIEKGSDVNAKTKDGRTPLDLAKYFKGEGHPFVKILQDAGARMDGGEL